MSTEQRPRGMTPRHWLAIGLALLLVGGLVGAQLWARPAPAPIATGSLVLVDNTTLLPLRGDVQIQAVGGSAFEPVVGQRALQVGDRIRTGSSGYASIVYFDGSSTALAPDTELVLQRFERDPVTGATAIIVQQPIGSTWTQAAASGHPYSGFLLASTAARFFARGSQFTTEVAPEGTMTVTAVEGGVFGRSDAGDVDLPVGFTTRVEPGQAPEAPVPAPQPAATLQVSITGPVRALLTDARGRSVGYHPDSEALVSQIPGARLVRNDDGSQVFSVPTPVENYDLTLHGLGAGQATVAMGVLHAGEREAPAAVRLEAAAATGDTLASSFAWRDGQVRDVRALAPAPGTPAGSAVLLLRHAPPALALAPTNTPIPEVAQPEDTPEAEALAAKPPAEPDAADVFSTFDSPPLAPRPAVVAPSVPRPAIVTQPAPVRPAPERTAVVREPVVRAPERPTPVPVVQGLAVDDDPPTARPILQPTQTPFVVTATPVPPTPVPPTRVPPTPLPPTPVPPSPLPTVPPPLPTPVPTQPPSRQAAPARPTIASNRPAIAPTATPYVAPPAAPTAVR